MRPTRRSVRHPPAVQYREPDSAESSPLASSSGAGRSGQSSAASISWSDAETTFDRLLRGQVVFPLLVFLVCDLTQASLPGRRGKENRPAKAYGRASKRSSTVPARARPSVIFPAPDSDWSGPSKGRDSVAGAQTRRRDVSEGLRSVERKRDESELASVEQRDGEASGLFGEPKMVGTPAVPSRRLLSAATVGPSASTPVAGRLWSASPLVSPFLPAADSVRTVTPGASPELVVVAGRAQTDRSAHGDSVVVPGPPPSPDLFSLPPAVTSTSQPLSPPRLTHQDSPAVRQSHQDSLAVRQSHQDSLAVGQSHQDSLAVGQSHQDSPAVGQSHQASPAVGQSHQDSLAMEQSHQASPAVGQSHQASPAVGQSHQASPVVGQSHQDSPAVGQSHHASPAVGQSHQASRVVGHSHHASPAVGQTMPETSVLATRAHQETRLSVEGADDSIADGPVDMLPRYRSAVFSSDEEAEEQETAEAPTGSVEARSALVSGDGASRLSSDEVRSDLSRFADSKMDAELRQDVPAAPMDATDGSLWFSADKSGTDPLSSRQTNLDGASPLVGCFVRVQRLSSDELRELTGAGGPSGAADVSEDPAESDAKMSPSSSQSSMGRMAECFVHLCRLEEVGAARDPSPAAEDNSRGEDSGLWKEDASDATKVESAADDGQMEVDQGPLEADHDGPLEVDEGPLLADHDGPLETDHGPSEADVSPLHLPPVLSPDRDKKSRPPAAAAAATPSLGAVLLALRAGKGWRRSLCQVDAAAADGGLRDWTVTPRPASDLPDRRRSLQPGRDRQEEPTGYTSRLRPLRSRRTTLATYVEEEEEDQEGDRVRTLMPPPPPPPPQPQQQEFVTHTLRSGRRVSMALPAPPPPAEVEWRTPRDARLSVALPPRRVSEMGTTGPQARQAGRRSMQLSHRELSEEQYSRAMAAFQALRDSLPALATPRAAADRTGGGGDALFASPVLPGAAERRSVRVSMAPLSECVPTPRRRSVLPVGFSPAPKHRRSSVYVSTDEAEATLQNGPDVSLNYDDPAARVLELCGLERPASFLQYSRRHKVTKKIGEGVYGEVFLCETKTSRSVIKIMPIEGDFEVNDAAQKSYGEVLSELLISKSLSDLHAGTEHAAEGYVRLLSSHVVRGAYPASLNKLWDKFDQDKGSENEHPRVFPSDQLFLVLEYSHAGTDLENFQFRDVDQAIAAFYQVAFSLAVGEAALEFEHRDLHWGNVLLREEDTDHLPGLLGGRRYRLPTAGLRATIIDFTLSRLRADGAVVYNNLAEDPTLFNAHGDHQFEVYRQMRTATDDRWRQHCPVTNIQWLYYLADKLCAGCAYEGAGSRRHRQQLRRLHQLRQLVNDFGSATQLVEALCGEWCER
ncbi:putative serine/threonine-protein kinase haspin [Amphibalanus amphitrite]|uniref:non-specific serine/threonine protein kinase n=1 Tax=Amphibalanus amphitrite TaxID=1232801 RepID=A0A6A4VIY9_AMPAM|nr:putative serine/threonine-protein kinase haspin [Amphibalanus amphitrite]KAF0291495.1 putative serine/threonine-protein kinase haspin [Amphibalanus amphitrite]